MSVRQALEGIKGVESVNVDLSKSSAEVTTSVQLPETVASAAIEESGYKLVSIH
jgi:copper chaperone CopZ